MSDLSASDELSLLFGLNADNDMIYSTKRTQSSSTMPTYGSVSGVHKLMEAWRKRTSLSDQNTAWMFVEQQTKPSALGSDAMLFWMQHRCLNHPDPAKAVAWLDAFDREASYAEWVEFPDMAQAVLRAFSYRLQHAPKNNVRAKAAEIISMVADVQSTVSAELLDSMGTLYLAVFPSDAKTTPAMKNMEYHLTSSLSNKWSSALVQWLQNNHTASGQHNKRLMQLSFCNQLENCVTKKNAPTMRVVAVGLQQWIEAGFSWDDLVSNEALTDLISSACTRADQSQTQKIKDLLLTKGATEQQVFALTVSVPALISMVGQNIYKSAGASAVAETVAQWNTVGAELSDAKRSTFASKAVLRMMEDVGGPHNRTINTLLRQFLASPQWGKAFAQAPMPMMDIENWCNEVLYAIGSSGHKACAARFQSPAMLSLTKTMQNMSGSVRCALWALGQGVGVDLDVGPMHTMNAYPVSKVDQKGAWINDWDIKKPVQQVLNAWTTGAEKAMLMNSVGNIDETTPHQKTRSVRKI